MYSVSSEKTRGLLHAWQMHKSIFNQTNKATQINPVNKILVMRYIKIKNKKMYLSLL